MTNKDRQHCARVGVLGGRFDPVHMGHTAIARAARSQLELDTVLLLVAKDPPHKPTYASAEHRYEMAVLAAREAGMECSRLELDRVGTTYTVDSLRELRNIYGKDAQIFYVIGADTLLQLLTWKQAPEVMRLCDFIVFYRPGEDTRQIARQAEVLRERFGARLHEGVSGPDISSTEIRQRLARGLSVDGFVSRDVEAYIKAHGLYGTNAIAQFDLERAKAILSQRLSPKRMAHSLRVCETAAGLARRFGADEKRAAVAGLFHDVAKDMTRSELLLAVETLSVDVDAEMLGHIPLLHAPVGAALAKKEFGVADVEVMSAIALHTTGKPGMTMLEKIIYLADAIEPGRKGADHIRKTAETDLDGALAMAMQHSMDYALSKGNTLYPVSLQAKQYLIENNTT